jgi:hypothetical protein
MGIGNTISEFTPALLLSLAIALFASLITFGAIFLVTSTFALGLDFLIIVGCVVGAAIGMGAFLISFKKLRSGISN